MTMRQDIPQGNKVRVAETEEVSTILVTLV